MHSIFSYLTTTTRNILLILLALVFSSSTFADEDLYPLTVTDDLGNTLVIAAPPTKISSKMLFTDELLIELVETERLSSLTQLSSDPTFSNIADTLPSGVNLLDMNVEQVIAHQPDLVFAANWTDAGKVKQLRDAGIAVYLIQTPFTLEEIQQKILTVGQIVGASNKAMALVDRMNEQLRDNLIEPEKRVTAIDYNSWGASSTKNSTWHSVLTEAKVTNLVAEFEGDQYGQAKMSKELVVKLNPQMMFIPGWIYGDAEAAEKFENQVRNDPAFSYVDAVKTNKVVSVPERLRGTYSHYIVDTILYINRAAYGSDHNDK
ncbi:ABC transporter substrate-binding protein [Vibrio sp. qd031]|uniref:ABC transporter substrate-binding protein n=1 Tax=Vibrio sp. qd031 TaxID=1603038 RepID=UPI000A10F68C|nr:ABC transporter substrate-binding protein [Vibrio sp. qd031]